MEGIVKPHGHSGRGRGFFFVAFPAGNRPALLSVCEHVRVALDASGVVNIHYVLFADVFKTFEFWGHAIYALDSGFECVRYNFKILSGLSGRLNSLFFLFSKASVCRS